MTGTQIVSTVTELTAAVAAGVREIEVQGTLRGMPMLTLSPGVSLRGGTLEFGARGLRLTSDNKLFDVTVVTADDDVAILNDTSVADLGTLTLRNVRTTGQVLLLADEAVRAGHVHVQGLRIDRADVRGRFRRPHGFGVDTLLGAFTLWNRQSSADAVLTAELLDIGVGSAAAPVRGSGVYVSGHGDGQGVADGGGTVQVSTLDTAEIHTDGGIPAGTPDLISGGVFVMYGAHVRHVVTHGSVTTYGPNDMVLDNWGDVDTWTVTAPVTSEGPSGIGFVNFGTIGRLDVQSPISTSGIGARGFNLYDGSLGHASFTSIATSGDGSIGVQVSKSLPVLEISGDLTTAGGQGRSLVKGVQTTLTAIGLSVKAGGEIGTVRVGGQVRTGGDHVTAIDIEGTVGRIDIAGGVHSDGADADAVHVRGDVPGLDEVVVHAGHGRALVHTA